VPVDHRSIGGFGAQLPLKTRLKKYSSAAASAVDAETGDVLALPNKIAPLPIIPSLGGSDRRQTSRSGDDGFGCD
jgi:hypothetical protein